MGGDVVGADIQENTVTEVLAVGPDVYKRQGLSPPHSGSGVRGGEGGAIGKGDAAAQLDGPGIAGGIVAPRLRQDGLGLHFQIQLHQPLIEQAADVLLGAVTAGDGIQGQALKIGQGKGADGDIPVSYTHLDVYKRQVIARALRARGDPSSPTRTFPIHIK